jgi:excinuclease ABC subunit C
MQNCINVTQSRRKAQLAYNIKHGTEPKSTRGSSVQSIFDLLREQIESEAIPATFVSGTGYEASHTLTDIESVEIQSVVSFVELNEGSDIVTDHLPSKPGVYFWKDGNGEILYIGKAKRLRSRVKSYLTPKANHSSRIRAMLKKAQVIEFILTPSDRDALMLENKLIKFHSPPYNVLLKDDETYPYICATIGEAFPQFIISPRRQEGQRASKYKYFGPYPNFTELNRILQGIEEEYDLRSKSFQAKFGSADMKREYQEDFYKALHEVFESKQSDGDESSLKSMRLKFEEASDLFESEHNLSRDVVAIGKSDDGSTVVIHVLQLREGMVTGQFSYTCELAFEMHTEEDFGDAIQVVLIQRHYISGGGATNHGRFSFFPEEILVQYRMPNSSEVKGIIQVARKMAELDKPQKKQTVKIRTPSISGARKETDYRALQCAINNAVQVANERSRVSTDNYPKSSVDGTAINELAALLSLERKPQRIECYDISHTQGENAVGSRVVFINGRPAPSLYRTFNIKSVIGPDDYASLEEVLERRFSKVWVNGEVTLVDESDPWSLPDLVVIDGGKGQLRAAIKGMAKANILPQQVLIQAATTSGDSENGMEVISFDEEEYKVRDAVPVVRVPVIALAKRHEEVYMTGYSKPVNDSTDSPALLLLRAIRDESHRRALKSHRSRRKQTNMSNA